jgi:dTDP-4-dehydrorhamnose 3,5-epimerase
VIYCETTLPGAYLLDIERREDERGYFARVMCSREFAEHGLVAQFVQTNHSYNRQRGTLRGMHFQVAPHAEVKLVRCVGGAIHDVIVDLREESPTYRKWEGFDLTAENGRVLYVPEGFAHGFVTLADDTHVIYQVSYPYTPGSEGGLRYDDPAIGIEWPEAMTVISEKDANWPLLGPRLRSSPRHDQQGNEGSQNPTPAKAFGRTT